MISKITILLSLFVYCECAYVSSSFWAPLADPRPLQYRVDARFHPHAALQARAAYRDKYGYRGENLIADLGNQIGPPARRPTDNAVYGDVKFHYTYPGAGGDGIQ